MTDAEGYNQARERILEIVDDALSGRINDTAALLSIQCIARAAPADPGEDWFKPPADGGAK